MPRPLHFPFDEADRIVVTDPINHPLRLLEDEATIEAIVTLLDAFTDGWEVPVRGVPVAMFRLNFYRGERFLGHIGLDSRFLVAHVQGGFWSRNIEPAIADRLQSLAGLGFGEPGRSSAAPQ